MSEEYIMPQSEDAVVPSAGKVLNFTPETKETDIDGILNKLFQYVNIGNTLSHIEKHVGYVVQIPLKHQKAFETGELFINENSKTGVMWPTLYKNLDNGKREIVANLPIKQTELYRGNPFQEIAQSYHSIYLQQQISELAEIMNRTCRAVERIEQGQKDDRIGLLLAGRDQILLSLELETVERNKGIELGRNTVFKAQKQILQTFKRRVSLFRPIPENRWKRFCMEFRHSGTLRERDKDFSEIQDYYSLYLDATKMLAVSYAICGHIEQAEKVYQIAEQDMAEINFEAVKTLRYIHEKNDQMLYYHAVDYVTAEKQECMNDAKEYDYITVQVNGEKILEVLENGGSKEIPSAEFGQ